MQQGQKRKLASPPAAPTPAAETTRRRASSAKPSTAATVDPADLGDVPELVYDGNDPNELKRLKRWVLGRHCPVGPVCGVMAPAWSCGATYVTICGLCDAEVDALTVWAAVRCGSLRCSLRVRDRRVGSFANMSVDRLHRNRLSAHQHREKERAYKDALESFISKLTVERDALRCGGGVAGTTAVVVGWWFSAHVANTSLRWRTCPSGCAAAIALPVAPRFPLLHNAPTLRAVVHTVRPSRRPWRRLWGRAALTWFFPIYYFSFWDLPGLL